MIRKRGATTYLAGAFIIAFLGITLLKGDTDQNDADPATTYSEKEKARIDGFWRLYTAASEQRRNGDLETAAKTYSDALSMNTRHEDTLYYLGNTLTQLSRHGEAIDVFEKLVVVNSLSARAHFQLGTIRSNTDSGDLFDLDAAEREFQRTLEINREESAPVQRLGEIALAKGQPEKAMRLLGDTIRTNEKAVSAYVLLGYLQWAQGDRAKARQLMNEARSRNGVEATPTGVAGEGDTRSGRLPDIQRNGLFTEHVQAAVADSVDASASEVETRYSELHRHILEVGSRWREMQSNASG